MSEKVITKYDERYDVVIEGSEVYVISHAYGKERKLSIYNRQGYKCVKIHNKTVGIHRLVAKCYLGEQPSGICVNHKDGVKANNHPSNLEYVTIAENVRHAVRMGLHVAADPMRSGRYKDGRCADRKKYKREWYLANRERLSKLDRERYLAQKRT